MALPAKGASPHTRGWTVVRTHQATADAGFPAHAGMDPKSGAWSRPG